MAWRNYLITPGGKSKGEWFYAPDIGEAFAQARARWPRAKAWHLITTKAK